MTRTIEHGKRTGYASLAAGGLKRDSFPMRLFMKGNAKHWNPADIDFRQDIEDFAAMTPGRPTRSGRRSPTTTSSKAVWR